MKRASIGAILTSSQCGTVLKALADETRLRLLESLLVDEKCVTTRVWNCVARSLMFPNISEFFAQGRQAGLLSHRADQLTRAVESSWAGTEFWMPRGALP